MLDESDHDELELLGSRARLLKAILKMSKGIGTSFTFSNIYESYIKESDGEKTSKAWVHRLLKDLTENKLVLIEDTKAKRYRYICDPNTILDGLSNIREITLREIEQEIEQLENKKQKLKSTDIHDLAKKLIESWTGEEQLPSSQFLKGLDEFHRVTNETIYHVAKKGDIIRTSVGSPAPFLGNFPTRLKRVFDSARKGVDVRYAVPPVNLDEMNGIFEGKAEREILIRMVQTLSEDTGPGLRVRVNPAGPKSHQFVSLNNDVLALWISEYPPTAAWITRDFNADLIDDITKTFDEQWEKAYPMRDILKEALEKRGIQVNTG